MWLNWIRIVKLDLSQIGIVNVTLKGTPVWLTLILIIKVNFIISAASSDQYLARKHTKNTFIKNCSSI